MGETDPAVPTAEPSPPPGPAPAPGLNGSVHTLPDGPMSGPPPQPEPAPAPAQLAPADLVAPPSPRARVAWYAGAAGLAVLLLFGGLRLDAADLRAPLAYDDDVLLILPMVKATLERGLGGHWRNERLGFPGVQELHDFPVIDHLHFAVLWLIGRVVSDYVIVFNLYFLLTWPLTTLTAMYAFRRLGLTLPVAAAGGLLYAFLPYHFMRGEQHYFLAAYWVVPLSWLPALAVCKGDLPFFRREPDGRYRPDLRRWGTVWQVLLAAATASAGAYYAFFACAIYAVAGVYGWFAHRTWKAAASAGVLIALVGAVGVLHHLPAISYAMANGPNSAAQRYPEEAETFGLKIAHLLLPVDGHNVTVLGWWKSGYNGGMRPLNNENTSATLGIVGAVGFLVLVGMLLFPARRGWPYGPLVTLTGCVTLFATIGGFASVFNLFVFAQVRCVNRLSIYLAFICLFAVLWPLDRFLVTRVGWARRLRYPAAAGLVALGVADQTPTAWYGKQIVAHTHKEQDRFWADRRFFRAVEEQLAAGPRDPLDPDAPPRVFTLPYIPYPEVPALHHLDAYEHARGYLHTAGVVWSFGAIKNRAADAWQREVALTLAPPAPRPDDFLNRLVCRGFDGVLVDKRGYPFAGKYTGNTVAHLIQTTAEQRARVRIPEVNHEDRWQVFLDLRPYREWLWNLDGGRTFADGARREREWAAVTFLRGFFTPPEWCDVPDQTWWGYAAGHGALVNPADRTRVFRLTAEFGVDARGLFRVALDGGAGVTWLNRDGGPGPWADEVVIEWPEGDGTPVPRPRGVVRDYLLEVPPGRHPIRFRCQVPPGFMPGNLPAFCYYVKDVKLVEVK